MKEIIVRYHEIALKGGNRAMFEQRLAANMKGLMWRERQRNHTVRKMYGRLLITANDFDDRFLGMLALTPGVKSFSIAECVKTRDPEEIAAFAKDYFERTRPRDRVFRVRIRVHRSDKHLPFRSGELELTLADRLLGPLPEDSYAVDLDHPDYALHVDARSEGIYLSHERIEGVGGLPVGVSSNALCLLSGGIDSPVAAYLMMRRGAAVDFLSFLSPPYTGEESEGKLVDLAARVARIGGKARLHIAPFTRVQEAIRDASPDRFRTLLYRRFMFRIGNLLADAAGYHAFITGESLGQVASQTVENMTRIGSCANRIVLRPLVGMDKDEAIAWARRIGTFDLSIRPIPDTCTLFAPRSPVIKARERDLEAIEEKLPVERLVREAFEGIAIREVGE